MQRRESSFCMLWRRRSQQPCEVSVKADKKGDAEVLTVADKADEEESEDEAADEEEESEEKEDAAN